MAKQLNIDLSVRADTSQAKQAMLNLQKSLNEIISTRTITINDESINNAKQAAIDLKHHLEAATNVNTGKLDLSKFSASLNKSGQSLQGLHGQLSAIGSTGQYAFLNLAQSIAKADASAISLGTKLGGLATTLKNTMKWQISSSLLHGFMGAVQGAYNYAQDLNESLNNIRIITGQNVDEMAKFAVEANNSAKALSATTTEYTNASLIYYQQGLSSNEVKARTDATIKLANISRQSAEEVSSQMTAIWNNFADGNDNLEYYEDVITKLGATTASSSSEIAEGLQKFASVADTVDLSYEKASASLATVVAETRQSADVVGTAFKTLFARLEGLNLGETLEDGTDLNKYSAALKSIGVNIKDQSGELKSMDNILNEIGAKWENLGKDQQVALAQTVAGVRQYTQFVALMDNYDKVLQNEETAKNSSGTVNEQAEIYAESWEAARDRVTAAAQEIYDQLLNDEAFISILNGFETFLGFISNIIDGLGGLKGVLLLIGSIFMQYYAKEMPVFMQKAIQNIQILTGAAEKHRQTVLDESNAVIQSMSNQTNSEALNAQITSMQKVSAMYKELAEKRHTLSSAEIEAYEQRIKDVETYGQIAEAIGKEVDKINEKGEALEWEASKQIGNQTSGIGSVYEDETKKLRDIAQNEQNALTQQIGEAKKNGTSQEAIDKLVEAAQKAKDRIKGFNEELHKIQTKGVSKKELLVGFKDAALQVGKMEAAIAATSEKTKTWAKDIRMAGNSGSKDLGQIKTEMSSYIEVLKRAGIETGDLSKRLSQVGNNKIELEKIRQELAYIGDIDLKSNIATAEAQLEAYKTSLVNLGANANILDQLEVTWKRGAISTEEYAAALEMVRNQQVGTLKHTIQTSEAFSKVASTVMQVSMAINALKNIGNIWSNEDISTGEKFLQTMTAMGTLLPIIITLTNKQKLAELSAVAAKILHIPASAGVAAAETAEAGAKTASAAATWTLIWPIGVLMAAIIALVAVIWLLVKAFEAWQKSTPEGQLKSANEELDNAKKLAEDAKSAFEDLKSTIEGYDSAVDSLKVLVKGTNEFKEAVQNANEQARKLIKTNDELQGKYHYNTETGLIEFDDGVLENLKDSGESRYKAAQISQLVAANNVAQAESNLAISDISKRNDTDILKGGVTGGVLTAVGAPTMGAGVWAATSMAQIKDIYENAQSSAALAHLTEIMNNQENISLEMAKNQGLLSEKEYELINSLDLTDMELKDLASKVKENTSAIVENNKQIIDSKFKDTKEYKYSKNKDELNAALAKQLQPLSKELYQSKYASGKGVSDQDAQKKYAKAMGYEWIKSDGESGKYKDSSGEEVSVNNEIARKYLAEQEALTSLTNNIKTTDNLLTKLKNDSDNIASQAALSKMTKGDFSDVDLVQEGKTYTVDELKGQLSDEEFKALYESLGYDSAENFANEFNRQLTQLTSVEDVIDSIELSDTAKGLFNDKLNSLFSDLTAGEAQNLSKGVNTLIESFGEDVGANYIDLLGDMTSKLSKEEKEFITKEMGKIDDIGDASQWDQFLKTIQESDKITENVKTSFVGYIETAKDVANATSKLTFAEFIKDMKKIQDVMKSISEGTRTMDKEAYDALVKQGVDTSKFIRTLSGEYEYIGSATGLLQEIGDKKKSELQAAIDGFSQAGDAILQSAENTTKLKESLNNFNNTTEESDEELSETEKFLKLISSIFQAIVERIKNKLSQLKEGLIIIGTLLKENVLDPFMKGLTTIFDLLVTAINNILEKIIGVINIIAKVRGEKGIDFEDVKLKDSKNWEEENKKKEAEDKEKEKHEDFMKNADELIPKIQAEGTQLSKEEREKFEKTTADQEIKAQQLKAEAEKKLQQNLNDEERAFYEERKKRADEELEKIKEVNEAWHQVDISILLSTTNLQEFDNALEKANKTGDVDYNIIADGLMNLAKNYDNCTEEVNKFQAAKASGSQEILKEAEATLRNSIAIGEMAKALDLEAEKVEEQANELITANNLTEEQYKVASKVAVLNQSMNKGVKELVDNWANYKKVLQSSEKGTEDYADATLKTKEALAQLLGVTNKDFIPDDFLEIPGVMDSIDKAIKGDENAINSLGATMAKATIEAMVFKEDMKQLGENDIAEELNSTKFQEYQTEVLNGINTLIEGITNGTLKAGEDISTLMGDTTTSWVESLNQMAYATGMSVEEMNSLLNELGVQTDVTVKDKEVETSVPEYTTYEIDGENVKDDKNTDLTSSGGYHIAKKSVTVQTGTKKVKGSISVAQINTGDDVGTAPTITYAGRDNVSSSALTPSSSDSSSSSKSSPTTKAASHEHEVHRYSNEENAIKGLSEQYDRLNKAKDKAFGKSRIQAIEAEIKHLKALREASGNYLDAIVGKGNADRVAKAIFKGENIGQMIANGSLGGTARADYNSLFSGLSASGKGVEYSAKDSNGNEWLASDNYSLGGFNSLFGTNLQFNLDSYGNIQNKDAIYNLLQNLKNNENDAYSRVADPSASSTTEYNRRMAYLEAIKERVDQFEETVDLMGEKTDEYIDYIASIQEKNAELITTKMEHGVNLGQKTIQRLERAIKVLGDNIYKTVEAMTSWYNATLKEGVAANKQQGEAYAQALEETAEKIRLYDQKDGYFNEDAIDPASAAELFSSIEDGYDSLIDDLLNRIEEGKAYYGNVLDYWNNKLDKVNSAIQTNTQLLEHFQTVLNLLGRSADYEAIGTILQGQLDNAQGDYISKKAQADVAKQAYERALQDREGLISRGISDEALEEYDENVLQIAFQNYQEKADAMYQSLEQYIEAANAKFENESNRLFAESEDRLTGKWGSFDALDNAMERQRAVSDEYLTKTNQLYETNTLLRKLSQDIDKTDSRIAKGKLKAFADEIEAMKTQEKLSKTDLEIAKARYELLQAEIALEEARNAKSTVRLQRDNEGNYGYVYTADQDAVNDAEQNLADKQNDLYNLVLSQAQEYGEKMIQLRKEHDAEIRALEDAYYKEGIISREEFEMQLQDIENKYRELEYAEKESYETAKLWLNQVGAEGQTEAWTNSFDEIITQHRLFNDESENNITELSNNIINNLNELDSQREYFTEEAKVGNEELKSSVDEIARSTDELSKKVAGKNGLADSMNTAMITAQNLATAFSNQYSELNKLIQSYADAADRANELYFKTVNLVNAQVALNHAQNGATSVTWGSGGASAVYSDNNNYNNTSNGIKDVTPNTTESSNNKQRYAVHDYITGKDIIVTEDEIDQYRLKGAGPSRFLIKKISSYGTPGHFKSGGYTGKWISAKGGMYTGSWNGPDLEENGKLAFLHQKELVLNASDTENLLEAVKFIRQISQSIDLQALSQAQGLSVQAAQFSAGGQTLEQEVTIHAEFPNVSDHNEIEEALSNLVNRAAQFASRY